MVGFILVLSLFIESYALCCVDCPDLTGNECTFCEEGLLIKGICVKTCPSGYIESEDECVESDLLLFSSYFFNFFDSWFFPQVSHLKNQKQLGTLEQGIFFDSNSILKSAKKIQLGPEFTFVLWIKPLSNGIILRSEALSIDYYSNNFEITLKLKDKVKLEPKNEKFIAVSTRTWKMIKIQVSQYTNSIVQITDTQNFQYYLNKEINFDACHFSLGGFEGFIYHFFLSNSLQLPSFSLLVPNLFFSQTFPNECIKCSSSCLDFPWCIEEICSICPQMIPQNLRSLGTCAVNFPNVQCLQTCPTMWVNNTGTCVSGTNTQAFVSFHHAFLQTFSDSNLYFNFETSNTQKNAYARGAYFDGATNSMKSSVPIQFSPASAYLFWIRPQSDGVFFTKMVSSSVIFQFTYSNTQMTFTSGSDSFSVKVSLNDWSALLLSITFLDINHASYSISTHSNSNSVTGNSPIIDLLTSETYFAFSKTFQGFLYSFTYWSYFSTSPTISTTTNACTGICTGCLIYPSDFSRCLWPCNLNSYYNNGCLPCLSSCTTCVTGVDCSVNIDPLCSTYSDYTICSQCKAYSQMTQGYCQCVSNFVMGTSNTCCNIFCTDCSTESIFCTCKAGLNNFCIGTCPTLYAFTGRSSCVLNDVDGLILWNFDVASNQVNDTSLSPCCNLINTLEDDLFLMNPFLQSTGPVPTKGQGLYFENNYLTNTHFTLAPIHTWIVWFNPFSSSSTSEIILQQGTSFAVEYNFTDINISYLFFSGNLGSTTCQISSNLNTWYFLSIIVTVSNQITIVTCNVKNVNSGESFSKVSSFADDFVYAGSDSNFLTVSTSFTGYIYEVKYYVSALSSSLIGHQFNSVGAASELLSYFSVCSPGYFVNSTNTCQSCNVGCLTCVNAEDCIVCANKYCYSCYDFYTDTDCKQCPYGQAFDFSSLTCLGCMNQCVSCWRLRIDACDQCSKVFVMSAEGICLVLCPIGFVTTNSGCVNPYNQSLAVNYKFNVLNNTVFDSVNSLPLFMGSTSNYFPNYDLDDPMTLPYRGLYFNGTSFATVGNSPSDLNKITLGNTHTFEIWAFPLSSGSNNGTIFSYYNTLQTFLTFVVVPINSNYFNFAIDYFLVSNSDPSVPIQTEILSSQLLYKKWVKVSWTFKYVNNVMQLNFYLNNIFSTTYSLPNQLLYEQIGTTFVYGKNLNLNYYVGYLYSFQFYTEAIQISQSRQLSLCLCDACTDAGDCLVSCDINRYSNAGLCTVCLGSCTNGCIRGTDCSLHPDPLCKSYTVLEQGSCNACCNNSQQLSTCQCIQNSIYNVLSSSCECASTYSLIDSECVRCNRWIQSSDITAQYSTNYQQIIFTFSLSVIQVNLTCDDIFLSLSTNLFGEGYYCEFNSGGNRLTLTLGSNNHFVTGTIYFKQGVLTGTNFQCGFYQNSLSVNVSFNQAMAPFPTAILDYPFLVLYQCQDLVITSYKSFGGLGRPLLTRFSIYSLPTNDYLNQFNTDFSQNSVNVFVPGNFLFNSTVFVSLTVKNIFNNTDTLNASISVLSSAYTLSVSYDSTISHIFLASKGATYLIHASNCKSDIGDVKINWKIVSIENNNTAVNETLLWNSQTKLGLFIIPPNSVPANSYIVFQSSVNDLTFESVGNVLLPLQALQNSPNIVVDIANGTFYRGNVLTIKADSTFDPNNQYNLKFNWSCVNSQQISCDSLIISPSSSILTLNAFLLNNVNYYFTITVEKYNSPVSENSISSRVIQINPVIAKVPQINIYDEITQSQPIFVSNNQPLILYANNSDTTNTYSYEWSSLTSAPYSVFSPLNQNSLSISTSSLLTGEYYTFQVLVTSNKVQGTYTYEFVINSPPHLGTLSVIPSKGYEFLTLFQITATGFIDDEQNYPLTYAFGYLDGNVERLLHFKNQSSTYETQLAYTGGITQVFSKIYDCFDSFQVYYSSVTVFLNENYNQQSLLDNIVSQSNSVFYDPQTTAGTLTIIGTAIINRDFTLYGQFFQGFGPDLDLVQNAFTFCVDGVNSMLKNISFYNAQGIDAISSALVLITNNPNLASTSNMKAMTYVINQFLLDSDNIYGISTQNAQNFLNSVINLAPINNTFLFFDPNSTITMMNTVQNIQSSTIKRMGLGENATVTFTNGDLQISVLAINSTKDFSIISQGFPNSYVIFPSNFSLYLENATSSNIGITLTTISQKNSSLIVTNKNSTRPSIVDITIFDRGTFLPLALNLGSGMISINIPVEGITSSFNPKCIYLDTITGYWSTSGCQLIQVKKESVLCQCNHLTTFSVMNFFDAGGSTIENTNIEAAFDLNLLNSINSSNAAGMYVFGFLFVLYILLALLMKKLDNKEYLQTFTVHHAEDILEKIPKKTNTPEQVNNDSENESEELIIGEPHNVSLVINTEYSTENQEEDKQNISVELINDKKEHDFKDPQEKIRVASMKQESELMNNLETLRETERGEKNNEKIEGSPTRADNEEMPVEGLRVKELIIQSHELFRLIYRPIKTETRLACLTLLFLKLLFQMFLIGLFYQKKVQTEGEKTYQSIGNIINSYSWDDFWVVVYSAVMTFILVAIVTYFLSYSKSMQDAYSSNFKNVLMRYKIKRMIGYLIAWTILMFSGWSVALFSIKFSTGTRGTWMLGTAIGALVEICFTSLFKEISLVYLRKYSQKIYEKLKNKN